MSNLWLAIEPDVVETRLMSTQAPVGTVLLARFPLLPKQPEALGLFLRGVAAWHGEPLCAVLDAEAEDVWRHPERWAQLLGDLDDACIRVEWVSYSAAVKTKDNAFFKPQLGNFERSRRLLSYAATGQCP
jgi:hypothetical protein